MDLDIRWLAAPRLTRLKSKIGDRLGRKICQNVGYECRRTVNNLRIYFMEVYNPLASADFKEQGILEFKNGELSEGKRPCKLEINNFF